MGATAKGWVLMMIGMVPVASVDQMVNIAYHTVQIAIMVSGLYITWKAGKQDKQDMGNGGSDFNN